MKSHRLPPEIAKAVRLALDLHESGRGDAVPAADVAAAKYIASSGHASDAHLREWCKWFGDHSSFDEMEFRREQQHYIAALINDGEECGDVSESVEWLMRGGYRGKAWARSIVGEPMDTFDIAARQRTADWQ